MRYSIRDRQWTDPHIPMADSFGRISYALFRTDDDIGRVIAARCPDRELLRVGVLLQDALHISQEDMTHLNSCEREIPLFILTDVGLGLLSGRYVLQGGMGLFLHIHCRPKAGARLINSGALGTETGGGYLRSRNVLDPGEKVTREDRDSYAALLEAWQTIREASDVFVPDQDGTIPLPRLREGIEELASFAGVKLTYALRKGNEVDPVAAFHRGRVHCYRPRLLEAVILCLLTEMRDRSATRCGVCRMETPDGNELPDLHGHRPLRLTFHYPVLPQVPRRELSMLADAHAYAAQVGYVSGMALRYSFDSRHACTEEGCPEQIVWLEWVEDPALLTSTDIKAGLQLQDDGEKCPIPGMEDEIPLL